MSKKRRQTDSTQISIFDLLRSYQSQPATYEGQLRCVDHLRAALRAAVKNCPLSIFQISGEISHLVGASITIDQIYSWTRESDELNGRQPRHIPAEYLPAFCRVTGSNDALRILGEKAGVFVAPGPDALRAEIQRLDEEIRDRQDKKRKRVMFLKEIERR